MTGEWRTGGGGNAYWLEISSYRGIVHGATHLYVRLRRPADDWEDDVHPPSRGHAFDTREAAIEAGIRRFDEVARPGDELYGYRHIDYLAGNGILVKVAGVES